MRPEKLIESFAKGLVQAFLDAPDADEKPEKKPKAKKQEDTRQMVLQTIAELTEPKGKEPAPSVADLDSLIRSQRPPESVYNPDGGEDEAEHEPWLTAG